MQFVPTKAIQHLTPLLTDLCERLDDPSIASNLDSSSHTLFSWLLTHALFAAFKAAMGPLPFAAVLCGLGFPNINSAATCSTAVDLTGRHGLVLQHYTLQIIHTKTPYSP